MMYPDNYPGRPPYSSDMIDGAIPLNVLNDYYDRVMAHIAAVQEAGAKIGVPVEQLKQHDQSKFSPTEFGAYALHFCGGGAPDLFAVAWLHHIHKNAHHWNHWLFADGFTPKGSKVENGAVEMPEHYALEMMADWQAANIVYSKSEDMSEWLASNMGRIMVHSRTAIFLRKILRELGYGKITDLTQFRHEREATV